MDYTILFIIPSTLVCSTIRRVLQEKELHYPVFALSTEDAYQKALECQKLGTRLIISQGMTAQYLTSRLDVSVMELPFSGIEAAIAIKSALEHSKRIIHMGTLSLNRYLKKSLRLLGLQENLISFCRLLIDEPQDVQTQRVIDEGFEVIIGGFTTVNYARKMGKHGIEFDVDEQVVETTLHNAREFVRQMIEEEEKLELINAILHSTSEGLIATNDRGEIFLANPAAEYIVQRYGESFYGFTLPQLMAESGLVDVMQDSGTERQGEADRRVIVKEVPIRAGERTMGSVVTLQKVEEIQELEYKIRKEILVKGLVAKSTFTDIAGTSKLIREVKKQAAIYARYDSTVLITGETGTGKELFAQSIHNESGRAYQPFVAINCASLPENLIESELFGYEKGAFTGANREGKPGLFEIANHGTIFLDEINEIPMAIQAKLLRVVQEREIIRIGGDKVVKVDIRIICSTNKDLRGLVQQSLFKEDLFYRLCVLEVQIPPLRERREDIAPIAHQLLRRLNKRYKKHVLSIAPGVIATLQELPLYGNVRELGNLVERMLVVTEGSTIGANALTSSVPTPPPDKQRGVHPSAGGENLRTLELEAIKKALRQTNGNKAAAARIMGIDPSTLWRKIKKYGISV